ncbi:MAG: ACT domain-containing protein [Bacteroidota bacterium]
MTLTIEPGRFAVCRLPAEAPLADWMWTGTLVSVTRRADELSVVCDEAAVPEGVQAETGWRALTVAGPLDFALTGILAELATVLADPGVSIFAISTFDTDVLLVRADALDTAIAALRAAGHHVSPTG